MRISVVVPTYERRQDLEECIKSLLNSDVLPLEIIVLDSSPWDGIPDSAIAHVTRYISIPHKSRIYARNVGIFLARGEIVAFLDDDTVVDRSWLSRLAESYVNPRVGGVGGRVIPHGKSREYHYRIRRSDTGKVQRDGLVLGNFDMPVGPLPVDHLPGCNMSFRRDALMQIGGFDERFQGNCFRDDTDVCLRTRDLGYELIYHPEALVWHKYRGRTASPEWSYWYVRNNTYFYFKNIFPRFPAFAPVFFYRQVFPPRDYVEKSGVHVGPPHALVLPMVRGLVDALSLLSPSRLAGGR